MQKGQHLLAFFRLLTNPTVFWWGSVFERPQVAIAIFFLSPCQRFQPQPPGHISPHEGRHHAKKPAKMRQQRH
ncbi:hypothetical protein, partial [Cedecea sp. NFIX57]|uniref:hypothetical protein n=1 Tax=Cedecea sp. NFIX57 TaxID=1566286 RepID=UPI001C38A7C0